MKGCIQSSSYTSMECTHLTKISSLRLTFFTASDMVHNRQLDLNVSNHMATS